MLPNSSISCAVIAVFNDRDTLDAKVAAVLDTGPEACELIVVDDGSTDGTAIPTANDKRLTFLRLPRNVGRPRALLAGLRQAEAPVVLLDAEFPEAGWRLDARRRAEGMTLRTHRCCGRLSDVAAGRS